LIGKVQGKRSSRETGANALDFQISGSHVKSLPTYRKAPYQRQQRFALKPQNETPLFA